MKPESSTVTGRGSGHDGRSAWPGPAATGVSETAMQSTCARVISLGHMSSTGQAGRPAARTIAGVHGCAVGERLQAYALDARPKVRAVPLEIHF